MSGVVTQVPSVAICIAAHNEDGNISRVLDLSLATLDSLLGQEHEVVVVDDDSKDNTATIVADRAASDRRVTLVRSGRNIGANAAFLLAVRQARTDLRFTVPGDLQVAPDQIWRCLQALESADCVCTRRRRRADPWYRAAMARAYNLVCRLVLGVPLHDVDSVFLVKREVVEKVAPTLVSSSDFRIVEFLVRAHRHFGYRLVEVDIDHHPRACGKPSSIKPREVARTFVDLTRFAVWLRRTTPSPASSSSA